MPHILGTSEAVPPDAVRAELERILASRYFQHAPRLSGFLGFVVETALRGERDAIKESVLSVEVFGRGTGPDFKDCSNVRVHATKVRARLAEYYRAEGRESPVRIDIPKGTYVPVFTACDVPPPIEPSAPAHRAGGSTSRSRYPAWAASILICALALTLLAMGWRSGPPDPHPSIAVLDIRNASGDDRDAWLSTALAEMLTEDLSASERLRVAPTGDVAQLAQETSVASVRAQLVQRRGELQDRLGVSYVVLADFRTTGGDIPSVQVDTQVERLRDGKTILHKSASGSQAQLYTLAAPIGSDVRQALHIPPADAGQRHGPDRESMRGYSEAVVRLRASDPVAARKLLEMSVQADPSNFLARSTLAETYLALGLEARAKVEAQAALVLAPPLVPLERLALEARCRAAMHDWASAIRSYTELWRVSPEVVDYGLKVALLQKDAGLLQPALRTIAALRKQRLTEADEARIDYEEALLHGLSGGNLKGLPLIRRCQTKAKALGFQYLYACARLREGGLLLNLWWEAKSPPDALDDARRICHQFGYRACEMSALRVLGNFYVGKDNQRALELYGQGVHLARQLGNRGGLVELLNGMSAAAGKQLLDQEAEARSREAIAIIDDADVTDKAHVQMNLAALLTVEGRLAEAERILGGIESRHVQDLAWNILMADLERNRGDYHAAALRIQQAIPIARTSDGQGDLMWALRIAFQIDRDQGDLRRAAADLRDLEKSRPATSDLPLLRAELALSQEKWTEALAAAVSQREQCRDFDDLVCQTNAALDKTEALLGARRAPEAIQTLDEVVPSLERSRRAPQRIRARAYRLQAQAL